MSAKSVVRECTAIKYLLCLFSDPEDFRLGVECWAANHSRSTYLDFIEISFLQVKVSEWKQSCYYNIISKSAKLELTVSYTQVVVLNYREPKHFCLIYDYFCVYLVNSYIIFGLNKLTKKYIYSCCFYSF